MGNFMNKLLISSICILACSLCYPEKSELGSEFETIIAQIGDDIQVQQKALISKNDKSAHLLSNIGMVSQREYEDFTDAYLEGYIQALVDVHYYEFNVSVLVKNRNVTLYNLPDNALISNSIFVFVSHLPEVANVQRGETISDTTVEKEEHHMVREKVSGIWFPQSTVLFQPLIADLMEPIYSVGYRYDDQVMGKNVIAISLGDTFPIFRWRNVFTWKGDLQIDIQGGVWTPFKMGGSWDEWAELVTTDYLVGIPLSYAIDQWSFRFRVYHVSSHLGDEYMVNHPDVQRVNPSMEAIDFYSSYQATEGIRVYFGPGWVFHSDKSFKIKPFYVQYGAEFRYFGHRDYYHMIYGSPFAAINVKNWQQHHWQFNVTAQIGYEWSKLQGVGRKVRIFAQYYNGYSEGQFFNLKTDYFSIRFSYGF